MRQVPFEEVLGFAERNSVFHAMETSAKENVNIEETFIELARVLFFPLFLLISVIIVIEYI